LAIRHPPPGRISWDTQLNKPPDERRTVVIDTSRIRYFLPILGPAQVVHYAQRDDLEFIEWWIGYLRTHERVSSTVRATRIAARDTDSAAASVAGAPRLVVTFHDGRSDRGEFLRLGQSLILQDRRLTVLDTDTLYQRFQVLPDPVADTRYPRTPSARSGMDRRQGVLA
jgi:hypothetical protein